MFAVGNNSKRNDSEKKIGNIFLIHRWSLSHRNILQPQRTSRTHTHRKASTVIGRIYNIYISMYYCRPNPLNTNQRLMHAYIRPTTKYAWKNFAMNALRILLSDHSLTHSLHSFNHSFIHSIIFIVMTVDRTNPVCVWVRVARVSFVGHCRRAIKFLNEHNIRLCLFITYA